MPRYSPRNVSSPLNFGWRPGLSTLKHRAFDLSPPPPRQEFDGPAVTSIGAFEDIHAQFEAKAGRFARMWPLYLFAPWIQDALKAANPDTLRYCNVTERGLVALRLTRRRCHAEFHYVSTVASPRYRHHCEAAFDVEAGAPGRLHRVCRYLTVDGRVPKHTRRRRAALVQGVHDLSSAMQPV